MSDFRRSPFGSPDGWHLKAHDRVPLYEDEIEELVAEPRSRVVVGRRGSGKTAFVRRVCELLDEAGNVLIYQDPTRAPSVDDLEAIESGVPEQARVEVWAEVWRVAVLRSFCTHLLCDAAFRPCIDEFDGMGFRLAWRDLLAESSMSPTPVSVSTEIASIGGLAAPRRAYLRDDRWSQLETQVAERLSRCSPACIVLDYEAVTTTPSAPGPWMRCQWGLIAAVGRLASGPLGPWLHVLATMREEHHVALQAVDPSTRVRDQALVLETDEQDIAQYATDMLTMVDDRQPESGLDGVVRLAGALTILNEERSCQEDAIRYLLRHTRYVPRDFVQLANELVRRDAAEVASSKDPVDQSAVRSVVRGHAHAVGSEQFAACTGSRAAQLRPEDVVARSLQSASSLPSRSLPDEVRNAVCDAGGDWLTVRQLDDLAVDTNGHFPVPLPDALWRAGLLGFRDADLPDGHAIFYSLRNSKPNLSTGSAYALHPCLIDALGLVHAGPAQPPTVPVLEMP